MKEQTQIHPVSVTCPPILRVEPSLTVYRVPTRMHGTKTRASEQVSSAQPARVQSPCLAPLE